MAGGRPSSFKPEFCEQATKLCMLGLTNAELAKWFDVSDTTIDNWLRDIPEFLGAVKEGRSGADNEVAAKLYHRATGYSHQAVKIFADPKTGAEKIVEYTEHYPPDPTSMIFWLKNRRPDLWRDVQSREHSGPNGKPIESTVTYTAEDAYKRMLDNGGT